MSLFGKRKADRPRTVDVMAAQAVQEDFTENFKAWLNAVERAQVESNADALTTEMLSSTGAIPVPRTNNGRLNDTQQIYLWSFARSYIATMLENMRVRASAATYRLEKSGYDSARSRRAADFWAGVEAYAAQVLG
jgi:hypothetical protein